MHDENVKIGVENLGTMALTKNPLNQQRSKHIDVKYHFLRDVVSKGIVDMYYVPSCENVADVFTKPVNNRKMSQLLDLQNERGC